MAEAHFYLECIDCGHTQPMTTSMVMCHDCGSMWMVARYDYAALSGDLLARWQRRSFNAWRYRELLPVREATNIVTLGEGGTPLISADNLGMMLGRRNIFIKDERQGPTHSFKDRQATVAISMLKEMNVTEAVVASTGNVGISYAAYSARAGIKQWVFFTSLVPPDKMRETALYGAQVIKITGTYDRSKQLAAEFADARGLHYDRGAKSIAAVESMKTVAFEMAEQLALRLPYTNANGRVQLRAPDWYIQSVSGGLGPYGVIKGFQELYEMGLVDKMPKIAVIQADGCAPMSNSFKAGLAQAEVVTNPRTHIATLSTGDPGRVYSLLRDYILKHGGDMESVSDEEAFRAMHVVAKMEGITTEPAAALTFAGLFKLVRQGKIARDEVVVVNCTGHTIPVEREILGEGWIRDVVVAGEDTSVPEPEHEGLLAALNRLDERVRSIAIIDDNPEAARLIRRILQARGEYTVHHAENGRAGLHLVHNTHPDLIVLDLMMPEMDGFQVLDALRADRTTSQIPVIVVSAKELTPDDRRRLDGQIQSLLQKGSFMDEDLLTEITSALGG